MIKIGVEIDLELLLERLKQFEKSEDEASKLFGEMGIAVPDQLSHDFAYLVLDLLCVPKDDAFEGFRRDFFTTDWWDYVDDKISLDQFLSNINDLLDRLPAGFHPLDA
jgi:hypothetical protein